MAVPVYALAGLALSVGPSEAWMFRWPLRVVPYFALPAALLLAIALAQGLSADHRRRRAAGSGLRHPGRRLPGRGDPPGPAARPRRVGAAGRGAHRGHRGGLAAPVATGRGGAQAASAVLLVGCVAVLVFQVSVFPRNQNLNDYRFPTSVTATGAALVAALPRHRPRGGEQRHGRASGDPAALSSELMFGNMLQAVGVHAVNSYYGMGFKAFTDALCIEFNGSVCPDALRRALRRVAGRAPAGGPAAAGHRRGAERPAGRGRRAAPGRLAGRRAHRGGHGAAPAAALPRPEGRLSDVPPGTAVADDVAAPRSEDVRIAGGPGGTVTFARLAWPGYTARVDGAEVPVRQGPAGLLTVDVPAGAHGLALSWSPPAFGVSLGSALLGLVLALAHAGARGVPAAPGPDPRRADRSPAWSRSRRAATSPPRPLRRPPGRRPVG